MNGVMAGAAHPQRSGDQVFLGEQFLKPLFAVQMLGYQVVSSELGNRAFAEFAVVRLRWELEHCGNTSRVSPMAPPDLRCIRPAPKNQCIRV